MATPAVDMYQQAQFPQSQHPSYHAHPNQQIEDSGPQKRQSRIPLFQQVRAMLHSRAASSVVEDAPRTDDRPRWDAYTGELSATGLPSSVQPSTYTAPYNEVTPMTPEPTARPTTRHGKLSVVSSVSSPISMIGADSMRAYDHNQEDWSPVSPIEGDTFDQYDLVPKPLTPRSLPLQPQPPSTTNSKNQVIKRKPAPRSASRAENIPPQDISPRPSNDLDAGPVTIDEHGQDHIQVPSTPPSKSRFSWTTYDASSSPAWQARNANRRSIDTQASRGPRAVSGNDQILKSRFSWSTVNTNTTTHRGMPETPPSVPVPAVPNRYMHNVHDTNSSPPMQSILSRRRPVQRSDRTDWEPAQRQRNFTAPVPSTRPPKSSQLHPHEARSKTLPPLNTTIQSTGKSKALPPPPDLTPIQACKLTHLEALQKQEADLALQRRNIEKAIAELRRLEVASPISVSWATVRDARERLCRNQLRLAEILLEEREVGVAISRARRKEGAEEGLWVRRVTG